MSNIINFKEQGVKVLLKKSNRLRKECDSTWDSLAAIKELEWTNQKNKIKCVTQIGNKITNTRNKLVKITNQIMQMEG